MQQQTYSITINASAPQIWKVLWDNTSFRDWANFIDEGMWLRGEVIEGAEVRFMSRHPDVGVTSLVEKLIPNERVTFRHIPENSEVRTIEPGEEWTGGEETYELAEANGHTALTITMDVPPVQEDNMKRVIPLALQRVKELAESTS